MTRDPLWRMIALARPRGARFVLGVLAGAVATASGVGLLSLAAWLIATAATHPPITALSTAVVLTRALGVSRGVARYLERLVTHDAALRTLADARVRVYARLARIEPIRRFRSGDLVSRLVSDTDATQDLLVRGLTPPLAALLTGAGAVALSTVRLVPGGLALAAGLLLAGLGVPLVAAALGRAPGRRQAAARGELSTALVDALHGAPDLVAYGAMDRAVRRVERADAELTRIARRDAGLLGLGAGASALLAGLTLWGTLLLGIAAVEAGTLGPVPLAVLVLTALAAFEIVAPLPAAAARLGAVRAGGARLFDVLDTPPAVRGPAGGAPRSSPAGGAPRSSPAGGAPRSSPAGGAPRSSPAGGAPRSSPAGGTPAPLEPGPLRVRGLRVRYARGEPWALDGLDLDLPPGRRIAVVGPSGSGKSTLAAVLFRFRDPDAGSVHLGDADLTEHTPDAARVLISGVPQHPHLFAGTVGANLRLARPGASDAELWDVLARARLDTHVAALPRGLATDIGVHGVRFSGGMRTRLALARALLADAPVLVLDEPTTHLDPGTRDAVLDDLLAAAEDRALLLITHDLARLDRMDTIHVVAGGRVVQHGTHAALLARDGWYRTAHRLPVLHD